MNPFTPSKDYPPIVRDCNPKDYLALGRGDPAVVRGHPRWVMSRSELRRFAECPSKWVQGTAEDDTDALRYGNLIDCLYLNPSRFEDLFIVAPATYEAPESKKKDAPMVDKKWTWHSPVCRAWREEREEEGYQVVTGEEVADAKRAIARLNEDAEIKEFRDCCNTAVNVNVDYHDKATGLIIPVKLLIDLLPATGHPKFGKSLGDLKSGEDASPQGWYRHVFKFGYHYQGALYTDAYSAVRPDEDRRSFYHIVTESHAPFEPAKHFLGEEFLELGRNQYLRDLALYCQCIKRRFFPGYDYQVTHQMNIRGWHLANPDARMMEQAYLGTYELPKEPTRTTAVEDEEGEVVP